MHRRLACALTFALLCGFPSLVAASDELHQRLIRIFQSDALSGKRFGPARWIRGGAAFTTLEPSAADATAEDIVEYDTASGKRSVLVSATQLTPKDAKKPLRIEDYQWDQGLNRLLVFTESKRTWRTNTRGDHWLLERASGSLKKLGGDASASSLMFAKFSPDGSLLAYVRANNLYVEDIATGAIRALTSDGSETLVNGASDWVYEEELNLRDAFRWSPDGKNIAFWQLDESGVEQYTIVNNTKSLYPELVKFPYPKAGTKNPSVRVGVVGIAGGQPQWMQIPGDPRENYLFRMDWADERSVAVAQLNRRQNVATFYLGDASSGAAKVIFRDQDDAWVFVPEGEGAARETQSFDWLKGRQSFLWLSERDGWRRAYTVSLNGGDPVAVTPAASDAMEVAGVDPEGRWIYYIASPENATERYLYRSRTDRPGTGERITPAGQRGTHQYDLSRIAGGPSIPIRHSTGFRPRTWSACRKKRASACWRRTICCDPMPPDCSIRRWSFSSCRWLRESRSMGGCSSRGTSTPRRSTRYWCTFMESRPAPRWTISGADAPGSSTARWLPMDTWW